MDPLSKNTIENYYTVVGFFHDLFRGEVGGEWRKEIEHETSLLCDLLGRANIFSISPDVVETVWNTVDDHLMERAGMDLPCRSKPVGILSNKVEYVEAEGGIPEECSEAINSILWEEGPYVSFPQNLPFDILYFGYGDGVSLSPFQQALRVPKDLPLPEYKGIKLSRSDLSRVCVLGHLVANTGDVFEFTRYVAQVPFKLPDGSVPSFEWDTDLTGSECPDVYNSDVLKTIKKGLIDFINNKLEYLDYDPVTLDFLDTLVPKKSKNWANRWYLVEEIRGFTYYNCRTGIESAPHYNVEGDLPFTLSGARLLSAERNDGVKFNAAEELKRLGLDGYWFNPWLFTPWLIPALISLINENNKTFVFQGNYDKNVRKDLGKKFKRFIKKKKKREILPTYYVIDIAPRIVRKISKKSVAKTGPLRNRSSLAYRHDRDGHERVAVRRGNLPIPPDEHQLLTLRGYSVYTEGQPSHEDKDRLVRRRHPLRGAGEWVAIKTSWVRSCVVGEESLPYRPAVRRLTKDSIIDLIKTG